MKTTRREFITGVCSALTLSPMIGFGKPTCDDELKDLIEFSKKCKIGDLKHGLVNFNPRPYQVEYFKNILESNTFVCRKCRQCGATTINLIYAHWMAERHPEKKVVLVFSNMSMEFRAMIMFNNMYNPTLKIPPSIEFTTNESIYGMAREQGWRNFYTQLKSGEHPYFNLNTILICDEYEFFKYWFCTELMVGGQIDFMKTIWVGTPIMPNDVMWEDGKSSKTITRMKITGEQVFPQFKLKEIRKCLVDDRFNKEFEV